MPKYLRKRTPEEVEQLKEAARMLRFRTTDILEAKNAYLTYAQIAKVLPISAQQARHFCTFKPREMSLEKVRDKQARSLTEE